MTAGHRREPKLQILREIVSRRAPGLTGLLTHVGAAPLTADQRDQLRSVLADEFVERGLREDDEPNAYGLQVEDLIDLVGRS
jgi:hypothetical protein